MTLLKLLGGADLTTMLGGAVHLQLADLHSPILFTDVLTFEDKQWYAKSCARSLKIRKDWIFMYILLTIKFIDNY